MVVILLIEIASVLYCNRYGTTEAALQIVHNDAKIEINQRTTIISCLFITASYDANYKSQMIVSIFLFLRIVNDYISRCAYSKVLQLLLTIRYTDLGIPRPRIQSPRLRHHHSI